jgi:hypothetical protein
MNLSTDAVQRLNSPKQAERPGMGWRAASAYAHYYATPKLKPKPSIWGER